ncbi:MAG: hypothetical protein CVU29_08180 [Betaproteobacteria bacterium HGW-Betaproteobacteria-22]|nr:MAG: hypothetical protein CVU29_08180 [Betaproteobacteria bacterium HGW-Betaproteobacteria-22]
MLKPLLIIIACLIPTIGFAKQWDFDVYLDQSKIGQHTFRLNDSNELVSQAKFNVKVLFINAYSYDHTAVERWQEGCLTSLDANTLENSAPTKVSGRRSDAGFEVDDGKTKQILPECPMTFAYWSQKMLMQPKLLNPQNGEWLDIKITRVGKEILEVKGEAVEALRYKLNASLAGKPKLNIDLWYKVENNDWVALKSITPEGYTINYKLK